MRIALDTNVLVSAFIANQGHPANLLELALTLEDIELVTSEPILKELEDVLARAEVRSRFNYTERDIRQIVNSIRKSSVTARLKSKFRLIEDDPKDDIILNTAYDGKANYLVSGDNHLLKLHRFRGIEIVNPRRMMEIIGKEFPELVLHF